MTLQEALDRTNAAARLWRSKIAALEASNRRARAMKAEGLQAGHPGVEAWKRESERIQREGSVAREECKRAYYAWLYHPQNVNPDLSLLE